VAVHTEEMLDCDPFFEKGLSGFINRFTEKVSKDDTITNNEIKQKQPKKEKQKSGFKRFIDRVFKGKDDK